VVPPRNVVQALLPENSQGTSPSGKRYSKPTTKEKPSARDRKLGEVKIRFSRVKASADGKDSPETLIWTDAWL